jgi:hypothetical protein
MDELEQALEVAIAQLGAHGITVVHGSLEESDRFPVVSLDLAEDPNDGCEDFLKLVKSLEVRVVVVERTLLDQADLDEASRILEENEEATAEDEARVRAELKKCQSKVNQLNSFRLLAIGVLPPIMYSLEYFAPWNELVYSTNEVLTTEPEPSHSRSISKTERARLARQLAENPDFQKARRQDAREFVARRVFGSKADELRLQLPSIVWEAQNIFDIDIRPGLEAKLREKALALLKAGKSHSAVAIECGMTRPRLTSLLGQASTEE